MTNLTLAIDEQVLREARIEALHRKTTVNKLVAEFLADVAGRRNRQAKAMAALLDMAGKQPIQLEEGSLSRAEIYDRS